MAILLPKVWMLVFHNHEIDIPVEHSRSGRPFLGIAACECCKPASAHEAPAVVCGAFGGTYVRDTAGGAAKRAGANATSSRAGCAQRHTDVPGHGTAAPDGPEPKSGLAGVADVHEERRHHGDQGCERRPVEIG